MREKYVSGPGKYQNQPPIVVFIDREQVWDTTGGDVDGPVGWFATAGHWIIREDSEGFVTGERYEDLWEVAQRFNELLRQHDNTLSEDDALERWDEYLDDIYGTVGFAHFEWDASTLLKEMDSIAYRCGFNDFVSSEGWTLV